MLKGKAIKLLENIQNILTENMYSEDFLGSILKEMIK